MKLASREIAKGEARTRTAEQKGFVPPPSRDVGARASA
jgi:hypothetical protein